MKENAFIGKSSKPAPKELAKELGVTKPFWDQLINDLADECDATEQEWNSYSPKAGWSLRLKRKKRVIIYLSPCHGSFRVSFALGEQALKAAQQVKLPSRISQTLREAKRYPEGYAVRFEIDGSEEVEAAKKLALAKIEN